MTEKPMNYLPQTRDDFRKAFAFGMDLVDANGITPAGVHVARHAGLEIQTNSRSDTERLASYLELPEGREEGQTNWTCFGTTDAGFPGLLIVTIYGPRA